MLVLTWSVGELSFVIASSFFFDSVVTEQCYPYQSGESGQEGTCLVPPRHHSATQRVTCPSRSTSSRLYQASPPYRIAPIVSSSKHDTCSLCCFNAGPASQTVDQHWNNTDFTSCSCWVIIWNALINILWVKKRQIICLWENKVDIHILKIKNGEDLNNITIILQMNNQWWFPRYSHCIAYHYCPFSPWFISLFLLSVGTWNYEGDTGQWTSSR